MKSKVEFQQDSLDAFRFALSRRAGKRRGNCERVYGLALLAGDWLGRGYAPLQPGRRAGTPPRRLEAAFTSPIWREAKRTGMAARRVPNDLWRVSRLITESHRWLSVNKNSPLQPAVAAVEHAVMTDSYETKTKSRSGVMTATEKKEFRTFSEGAEAARIGEGAD